MRRAALTEECGLRERIAAMFRGGRISATKKRAVSRVGIRLWMYAP